MNEPEQRRRDELAASDRDGATMNETMIVEPADDTTVDEPDVDDAYVSEPPRRNVVTMGRSAFIAMVSLGAIAILALGAATLWLALDRGDGDDPVVATVNGEQIRRSEYDQAVAQSSGEDVLDNLILERLIMSEARKRNITPDNAEVTRQLDEFKQQAGGEQAFQSLLRQQGYTEVSLTRQLEIGALLRQMVADQVQVTDQEVDSQYQANAQQFQGQSEAEAKQEIREGLREQKENTAARSLLEQLRAEAEIETNIPGRPNGSS
jgi:hypothetical protein